MEQPKIERMLRLMKIMSGNENYTITELAKMLGTTYRSIYRYIDTFRASGFVVEKVCSNVYRLGKMSKTNVDLRKLIHFTEEEAYIINGLIMGLDNSNALKTNLKKKLSSIYNVTNIAEYIENKDIAKSIENIGIAIREKKKVILRGYESSNSKRVSDRFIEPFEFTLNFVDIWGYDIESLSNKVFKISRIKEVITIDDTWSYEDRHKKTRTDCFRMSGDVGIPVKIALSMMGKNLLLEEYPLASNDLKYTEGSWILETEVFSLEGIGRFCIGLADQIKIIEGNELKEYIKAFIKKNFK